MSATFLPDGGNVMISKSYMFCSQNLGLEGRDSARRYKRYFEVSDNM